MDYVIVGNSAAGIGAVEGIRSLDKAGRITLFSDEPYHTYSRPLISYYLFGKVTEDKMYYRPPDFYERLDVTARLGTRVNSLSTAEKELVLESGEKVGFERLLLATGGKPIVPPMPGRDLEGVFTFLKWDDVKALEKTLYPGVRTVVIGAGLIGLKATEALCHRGAEVAVVELANRVLSAILDEGAAGLVQESLAERGVRFFLENTVAEILGADGRVKGVRLQDGTELPCERLVIAIGVSPNTSLAQGTEVAVNRGILVDEFLATNVAGIFAAGDVAEGYDFLFRQRRVLPILPNAYKQGFSAGVNMAGGTESHRGGFAMNSIGFFDLPMITAGIVKPESSEFRELIHTDAAKRVYKKIVLREGKIVGFIALNAIDRAGILTGLMEKEIDVTPFQEHLLRENFGYLHFPKEYRQQELWKGVLKRERA
ncbi:nitrite reductase [NAD(P)H] [Peptococcaceae bacterium CEB3]|nr:nitrite reductase [NAD(P)H] [Peptococcaceae bacterium CEB3]